LYKRVASVGEFYMGLVVLALVCDDVRIAGDFKVGDSGNVGRRCSGKGRLRR
jgi:hypothetical protein